MAYAMKDELIDFELVLETHSAGDLVIIKSIPEILYFVQNEHVAQFIYHSVPMRVMVERRKAEKARRLLKNVKLSSAYSGLKRL